MTSFSFDISDKDLAGAQFISKVGRRIIRAFVQKMKDEKLTQNQLADKLQVNKSTVSTMLRGNSNLTARTIGEISWALDLDPDLVLQPLADTPSNHRNRAVISVRHMKSGDLSTPQIRFLTGNHP